MTTALDDPDRLFDEIIRNAKPVRDLFAGEMIADIEADDFLITLDYFRMLNVHPTSVKIRGTVGGDTDSVLSTYFALRRLMSVAFMTCEQG